MCSGGLENMVKKEWTCFCFFRSTPQCRKNAEYRTPDTQPYAWDVDLTRRICEGRNF